MSAPVNRKTQPQPAAAKQDTTAEAKSKENTAPKPAPTIAARAAVDDVDDLSCVELAAVPLQIEDLDYLELTKPATNNRAVEQKPQEENKSQQPAATDTDNPAAVCRRRGHQGCL